ncbi:GPAA1 [Bugula neritina]|uniref:GPAA1 n=1 Tax=Bugula neritina TaxID=10212 RepID=A0A7J7IW48_BUGNE|nr:GPAA1 [Bugula neritina]
MVMSVPLRPLSSGLAATDGSVAIMLALASHMIKHTYWSKDIIFLFTQHEFVGVQAWLDGYFEVQTSSYVKAERLPARAGLIQAAINLELSGMSFGGIDVLIEGINGLLPNLDLVNLVHKLARENGIRSTIHHRPDLFSKDLDKLVPHNILTTFTMMANLATGMPSGNHGLFLRFRVDSLTIKSAPGGSSGLNSVGQLVEGVFRSINNLLEKFHQSFFFYLMPCTYRYISIGLYIPPFALMVAASLIQAIMLWSRFTFEVDTKKSKLIANQDQAFTSDGKFTDDTIHTLRLPDNVVQGVYSLIPLIVGCHLSGLMLLKAPSLFGGGEVKQMPAADTVILGGLAGIVSSMMLIRTVLRKEEFDGINWYLFKTISLIYHGLTLFLLSLLNISLAAIVAAFTVPVYTVIRPTSYKLLTGLQMLLLLLISPVSIILICQTLYNVVTGNAQIHSLEFFSLLTDLQHSVLYAIIDHLVYKNYLLNIVCLVLYPTWLMFWSLLFMNV